MSQITLLTEVQHDFAKFYHQALDNREIIFIQNADEQVALIAADELNSLLETAHLLKSPKNAQRLLTALHRAQTQDLPTQEVTELKRRLLSTD